MMDICSTMVWMRLLVLFLFHVSLVESQQASSPPHPTGELGTDNLSFPWSRLRLPRYIIPLHYHLLLHPNLTSLSFTGSVQIQIDVQNNTNWVVLHSKGLQISKATIVDQNLAHLSDQVLPVLHNPSHEQIGIFSPRVLSSGQKYFLYIEFGAELAEGFYGFYRSSYRTSTGETRTLASTHFEPTSARMAFPCFDEPSFKANFSVRIRRNPEYISLSNMPVVKTVEVDDGLLEDQFDASVKMSTYLVAFVICDFRSVTATTASGVQVSIYATPEKWLQTRYALEVAVKMLDFYEDYFNIHYPLPKQDLIAIPDFQSGAMENWGLTTYRETSLLFDPLTSSISDKLWVTMVIGHELAHQWFGNLVTMEWWNDIWLNEGFARYMEYISVEATYPDLKVEEYLLHTCFSAVGHDSLNSSRPISSPAESPTQIKQMFDTVSYDKMYILRFFREVVDQQTWSDEGSVSERRLRSEVLSLACHLDYPACLERARQSFKDWLQSNGTLNLPTDVAETVFSVGAQDDHGWASLLHTYNISLSAAQKSKILFALTCSRDTNKLHRLLELGLEGKVIRSQDLSSLILMVARNPQGHHLAWNFVKKNWDTLVQKFQLGSFCIRNIIIGTTNQFSSPEELSEVQLFFESIKEQVSQLRATQVALDNVQKNVRWIQRNLETLRNWLHKQIK